MTAVTHGRNATYTAGCRCQDCRAAHAAHKRRYRAARDKADGVTRRPSGGDWVLDYRAGRIP